MAVKSGRVSAAARRPKAEVQQEFAKIQEQVESEQQLKDAKTEGVTRLREAEVRQSASGISVESVAQRIPALGVEISRSLADISEKLTQEVKLLATVQEAVAMEQAKNRPQS